MMMLMQQFSDPPGKFPQFSPPQTPQSTANGRRIQIANAQDRHQRQSKEEDVNPTVNCKSPAPFRLVRETARLRASTGALPVCIKQKISIAFDYCRSTCLHGRCCTRLQRQQICQLLAREGDGTRMLCLLWQHASPLVLPCSIPGTPLLHVPPDVKEHNRADSVNGEEM